MQKTMLACAISSLVLTACGGGSGSSDPVPTQDPQLKELNGSVILSADRTVSALSVYFDENANKKHDQGEPSTTTSQDGSYNLELTEAQFNQRNQIAVRTTTTATQPRAANTTEVTYSALPGEDPNTFITPYTSKVVDQLEDSLQMIAEGTTELETLEVRKGIIEQQLLNEVEMSLGSGTNITARELFGDFTESAEALKLTEKAKLEESAREEKTIEEDKEKEALEPALPGETLSVRVNINYLSMIEHYTGKIIDLKEKETVIRTKKADGTDKYEGTVTKWKLDTNCTESDLTDTNCVYEKAEWTETLGVQDEKGLRSYEHQGHWVKDINQDGLFQFEGQAVETGEKMADGSYLSYKAYYDETNAIDEYGIDNDRQYDGTELLIEDEVNLNIVDFAAEVTNRIYQDDVQKPKFAANANINFEQYIEFEDRDGNNGDLEKATYSQENYQAFLNDGSVIDELSKDWDADGTVNQYIYNEVDSQGSTKHKTSEPKWANGSFEQYPDFFAHYRWDGKELINNWLDFSSSYDAKSGIYCDSGDYSILNLNGVIKYDDAQINGWSKCSEALENPVNKDLTIEYSAYYDKRLEEFSEQSPYSDSFGHEVNVLEKDTETGITVTYKFAQWGQQSEGDLIKDLKGKVISLLNENNYQANKITIDDIEGLSEVAAIANASYVYDDKGEARQWFYRINQEEATGEKTTLESFDIGIDMLKGWTFSPVGGGAAVNNNKLDNAYRYSMASNQHATGNSLSFSFGYADSNDEWQTITLDLTLAE